MNTNRALLQHINRLYRCRPNNIVHLVFPYRSTRLLPMSSAVTFVSDLQYRNHSGCSSSTETIHSEMPSVAKVSQPDLSLPPAKRVKMETLQNPPAAAAPSTFPLQDDITPNHLIPSESLPTLHEFHIPDQGPVPLSTSPLNYENGIFLGPMVRIGTLPTRLLSLEYGADLVWGPEIVDRAIIGTERQVDPKTGVVKFVKDHKQIFSCHPIERPYLVYQIGTANPEQAADAVKIITAHDDVAAVDLNCGCPKPFSTHAGMGANLLSTPDLLCNILKAIRRAAPPHVAVTCKIRLLPSQADTLVLVEQIVRTGAIQCLTVHCRTKHMRPREPALLDRLKEIVDHVKLISTSLGQKIPVVCNGDCWDASVAGKIKELTGVTSTMIARGAEANPSCFRPQGSLSIPETIAPKWVKYAIAFDHPVGNTKYCLGALSFKPSDSIPKEAQQQLNGGIKSMSKKQLVAIRSGISRAKTQEDLAKVFGVDLESTRALDVENELFKDLKQALTERIKSASSGFDGQRVGAVVENANQSASGGSGQLSGNGQTHDDGQSKAGDNVSQPEWKRLIAETIGKHIKDERSILYYALSTVELPTSVHDAAKPHVRYLVHRGFVNEKRDGEQPGGIARENPHFESNPCLLTTTDVRTAKVEQLTIQSRLRAEGTDGSHGGEAEIAWWFESSQIQLRISGTVHILPTPGHPLRIYFPFERLAPAKVASLESSTEPFDWDAERMRIFNKLNAGLLASFCKPLPGSDHPRKSLLATAKPKDENSSPWPLELPQPGKEETEQQKQLLAQGEKNFALVVIEPRRVDLLKLADDQRIIYELEPGHNASTGRWNARRVVP